MGLVGLAVLLLAVPKPGSVGQEYGVTFSARHASGIGLNWQEMYRAMLDDLQVRHIRLVAYWDEIEPSEGEYRWDDLDWQLAEATARDADVILVVGRKVPRWPECFVPEWATMLSADLQQQKAVDFLTAVIERYRDNATISMWQVENEPFLDFGVCLAGDKKFLEAEVATVRRLDARPIMITDSGELNWWIAAASHGDVLGTTLYRTVYSSRTQRLFRYDYLLGAWTYRLKSRLVNLVTGSSVMISELQGEPWGSKPFTEMTAEERLASLSPQRLAYIQRFAAKTQLSRAYWWGVEYWYWEMVMNGNTAFWEQASQFFVADKEQNRSAEDAKQR